MNKRSFFKALGLGVAAISMGQVLIPKAADAFKWKRSADTGIWVLNDEWVHAPYQMTCIMNPNVSPDLFCQFRTVIHPPYAEVVLQDGERIFKEQLPLRYNTPDGLPIPPVVQWQRGEKRPTGFTVDNVQA